MPDCDSAFLEGASAALVGVLSGLEERLAPSDTVALLLRPQRSRILCAIAATRGLSQMRLAAILRMPPSNVSGYLKDLASAGLVEPSIPSAGIGKSWRLTPWTTRNLGRLLAGEIGQTVPSDEMSRALSAVGLGGAPASAASNAAPSAASADRQDLGIPLEGVAARSGNETKLNRYFESKLFVVNTKSPSWLPLRGIPDENKELSPADSGTRTQLAPEAVTREADDWITGNLASRSSRVGRRVAGMSVSAGTLGG